MIANSIRTCLRNLQRLYDGVRDAEHEAGSQGNTSLLCRRTLSILDHFKLWVHEFGAEEGFLDKRLERSSHVRQLVSQDLDRLEQSLQQGLPASILTAEDMHATVNDLQCIIDGLFDVSLAIQRPEPDIADEICTDVYTGADLLHAERNFPKAQRRLLKRLATANSLRRRHLIKLRDRHETAPDTDAHNQSVLGSTSPATSEFSDIFDQPSSSRGTGTESSYSSDADTSHSRLPPPPAGVYEQKPFECPICFKRQTNIKTRSSWKKHVFADLQAYICTFEDCPRKASMFSSRDEWYAHELEQHQNKTLWVCWDNTGQTFTSEEAFENHMRSNHAGTFADHQLSSISNFCKQVREESVTECSLCEDSKRFIKMGRRRHIAQHLEELALFALPNLDESRDELDSEDSDNSVEDLKVDPTAETKISRYGVSDTTATATSDSQIASKQSLERNQLYQPHSVESDIDPFDEIVGDGPILKGTPGSYEYLDPSYRIVDNEWEFFVRGRVFQMLLIENASEGAPPGSVNESRIQYGERAYARISRFVVVEAKPDRHYSNCIPITTYGGRATVRKSKAEQSEHGVIYTGDQPPQRLEEEVDLRKDPIKVDIGDLSMKLSTESRINYAFTRPIQHNVKVKDVGMIAKRDMFKLNAYWSSYK